MYEIEYKGKTYKIMTTQFTLGDMAKMVAFTDALVHFSQLYIDRDTVVSKTRENYLSSYAKACVIVQQGLTFGSNETMLNKITISNLMDMDKGFIKFILKKYKDNVEPPIVTDEEDAKKK